MSNSTTNRLRNVFEGHPWYGHSVLHKLEQMDHNKVNDIPSPSFNSVARLLQHIINWRKLAIEKMKGNVDFDIEVNSELDWPCITIETQQQWLNQINELKQTQQELLHLLEGATTAFLQQKVPGRNYNVEYLAEGIIQHDVYHLGQIAIIEKLAKTQS